MAGGEAKPARRRLSALAFLAAAACASDGVVVSPTSFYAAYTPTVLNYAATAGGIKVEVLGNPFDVPQQDLGLAITRAMTGAHFGQPVAFVTTPPEGFRSPYRVVMAFDGARAHTEQVLCAKSAQIQPRQTGEIRVYGALCAAAQPLTGVSGRLAEAGGPGDPRFQRLIRRLALNLLPPGNPDRRRSSSGLMFGF